jgi:DNA sulfur modification protein DndE
MNDFTRLRLSIDSTKKLQQLKARTGLTSNILSRFALCYSLNDSMLANPNDYDEGGQELNRYTLLGEWDPLYIALVKQRIIQDKLDPDKDLYDQIRAHINRGTGYIYPRIKSLTDLYNLLPESIKTK